MGEEVMSKWVMGAVGGFAEVPSGILAGASAQARVFLERQEAAEFSGDLVDEVWAPEVLPQFEAWFPREEVSRLGFRASLAGMSRVQIVATAGVDKHVDDIHGYVLIWVLHNDGLRFSQGRVAHIPKAGEWFIFDDRVRHAVREGVNSTALVCVSVPLVQV